MLRLVRLIVALVGALTVACALAITWGRHHAAPPRILFMSERDGNWEIYRMDQTGRNQRNLTNTPSYDGSPQWFRDGIVYISYAAQNSEIYWMRFDGSRKKRLTTSQNNPVDLPRWSPDGQWIVVQEGYSPNRDIIQLSADGSQRRNLTKSLEWDDVNPQWSPDGRWILFESLYEDQRNLLRIRADGSDDPEPLAGASLQVATPQWSPDGQWIVFVAAIDSDEEIYRMRADGSDVQRLTTSPGRDIWPVWSPDSAWILFQSQRAGTNDMYRMRADGSDQQNLTQGIFTVLTVPQWSPDGARIVFGGRRASNDDIYMMDADGSDMQRLTTNPAKDWNPQWSPPFAASSWSAWPGVVIGIALVGVGVVRPRGRG